jgi:hypothetical protein
MGRRQLVTEERRKVRLIEVNEKCRHLLKLTCKGTLRHVLIRVYRLEIANFLLTFMLVFSAQLCDCTLLCCPVTPLLTLSHSLWFNSPLQCE